MKIANVCVLGGTGFVGRHLVAHLASCGRQVKVLTRRPERYRDNKVCPTVKLIAADIREPATLQRELAGMDAVVFLPGILHETPHQRFQDVHVELPRRVVEACSQVGVGRLLHMSALNADARQAPSDYLRTKGEAEVIVRAAAARGLAVTIFRPSVIFGRDDSFFNRFARLIRLNPVIPLACPNARMAPVFVGDVVRAFEKTLEDPASYGQGYDLCGPEVFTLQQIVERTAAMMGRHRTIVPLGDGMSRLMARLLQFAPGKPMTPDNYRSLQVDSVCLGQDGLRSLGIEPTSVGAEMPLHFQRRSQRARYDKLREVARRD